MFGLMGIYLSSLNNPSMYKTFYIPSYIKRGIQLKDIIFATNQENFFDHILKIREILLEIFVNNISSVIIQQYLAQSLNEYFNTNQIIQCEIAEMVAKIDYETSISNKDVLFTERFILSLLKKLLFHQNIQTVDVNIDIDVKVKDVNVDVDIKVKDVDVEVKKRGRKKKV